MEVYAIINQKGGVGKSTAALAIGAGLRRKKKEVLYIDLDAQGNLSYTLRADTGGYNALGALQRPETVIQEIQRTGEGDVLASTPGLALADTILTDTGKEYRLKEALDKVNTYYDYCIIDTPPALGILTVNALTACTGAIIPAQANIYSLQGIAQLNATIETVRKYCNPKLTIIGIMLNYFKGRSILQREVAEMLEQAAKDLKTKLFKTRIRECQALAEAQTRRVNIFDYSPRSNAAQDYEALVNEILKGRKQ